VRRGTTVGAYTARIIAQKSRELSLGQHKPADASAVLTGKTNAIHSVNLKQLTFIPPLKLRNGSINSFGTPPGDLRSHKRRGAPPTGTPPAGAPAINSSDDGNWLLQLLMARCAHGAVKVAVTTRAAYRQS
jgi:hypothetical protein